jgi:hypothetical protein
MCTSIYTPVKKIGGKNIALIKSWKSEAPEVHTLIKRMTCELGEGKQETAYSLLTASASGIGKSGSISQFRVHRVQSAVALVIIWKGC